jgi:hypothetical protein
MENRYCVFCKELLELSGRCTREHDHWKYRNPHALQKAIEELQCKLNNSEIFFGTISGTTIKETDGAKTETDQQCEIESYLDVIRTRRRK